MPRCLPVEKEQYAINEYEELIACYQKLLDKTRFKEGISYLRLMINRCQTSILHIKSIIELDKVAQVFDYDSQKPLTLKEIELVNQYVKSSRKYALDYLHLYKEMLPDRGGEGQLVSYYATILVFIDAVGATFNTDISLKEIEEYDAPPMPDDKVK